MSVSRLAPTPSGFIHLGNAYHFLLCWLIIRTQKGKLYLRIDDLDQERVREEYVEDIFRTLEWMGIDYDEGPANVSNLMTYVRQHQGLAHFHDTLRLLKEKGGMYGCIQSRKAISTYSHDGQYPIQFRGQATPLAFEGAAWRMKVPDPCVINWEDHILGKQQVNIYNEMRDFVVKRKDGIPAYQLASLVDDIRLGINVIIRGEDLCTSTAAQLWLSDVLGWEAFRQVQFYHHPLIVHASGAKLSKSSGVLSIRQMRNHGFQLSAFFKGFASWLRMPEDSIDNLNELSYAFKSLIEDQNNPFYYTLHEEDA